MDFSIDSKTDKINELNKCFIDDVKLGLGRKRKSMPSKYFYDDIGSKLFEDIMNLKEYYLTNSEFEVLSQKGKEILSSLQLEEGEELEVVELGAGDGLKTKQLLKCFQDHKLPFVYRPVDISQGAISDLEKSMKEEYPNIKVDGIVDDYNHAVENLKFDGKRKLVLFLGSNIGNLTHEESKTFFQQVRASLLPGDYLFTGFDLVKDPTVILSAYNDSLGVTSAFNINLLRRMNNELGANFDLSAFKHFPVYDPEKQEARSYLISLKAQKVVFSKIDFEVEFKIGEYIHTEISRKYELEDIQDFASQTGFEVNKNFFDCRHYFVDSLWKCL